MLHSDRNSGMRIWIFASTFQVPHFILVLFPSAQGLFRIPNFCHWTSSFEIVSNLHPKSSRTKGSFKPVTLPTKDHLAQQISLNEKCFLCHSFDFIFILFTGKPGGRTVTIPLHLNRSTSYIWRKLFLRGRYLRLISGNLWSYLQDLDMRSGWHLIVSIWLWGSWLGFMLIMSGIDAGWWFRNCL